MRFIGQFFFCLMLVACCCEALPSSIRQVSVQQLELAECLLPEDHPLQKPLKKVFLNPHVFDSSIAIQQAGFMLLNHAHKPLMVARSPILEHYLIKKFKNKIPLKKQLKNYLMRIRAARALREFIRINHLKHIVVPQKWLYRLPKRFDHPKTGESSYVLIVEEMDICSGGDDVDGEVAQRYRTIDWDVLRELCIVLYHFRGLDSSLRNMPFTRQGKIAFVDTEHWWDAKREFLRHVKRYLTQDRLEYGLAVFEELQAEQQR